MGRSESSDGVFARRAPASAADLDYQLMRVPAGGKLSGTILSHDLVCARVHYYQRRTTPHTDGECEACEHKTRLEWKGWVAVWSPQTRVIGILELTKRAMIPLEKWFDEHRTLRGAVVVVARIGRDINGKLFSTIHPGSIDRDLLPKSPNIEQLLARMWRRKGWEHIAPEPKQIIRMDATEGGVG